MSTFYDVGENQATLVSSCRTLFFSDNATRKEIELEYNCANLQDEIPKSLCSVDVKNTINEFFAHSLKTTIENCRGAERRRYVISKARIPTM